MLLSRKSLSYIRLLNIFYYFFITNNYYEFTKGGKNLWVRRDPQGFREKLSPIILSMSIGAHAAILAVGCCYDWAQFECIPFYERVVFIVFIQLYLAVILNQIFLLLLRNQFFNLNSSLFGMNNKFGKELNGRAMIVLQSNYYVYQFRNISGFERRTKQ